jgi:ABC-type uncharacterized transport system ATPase subunit
MSILIEQITKRYGDHAVVDRVSLDVAEKHDPAHGRGPYTA